MKKSLFLLYSPMILFPAMLGAFSSQTNAAILTLSGLETDKGSLIVNVYSDEESWLKPQKAVFSKTLTTKENIVELNIDLKNGDYAIHTFQDLNKNGKLDMKWLPPGPSEPWVVSNNAQGTMGPPSFKDARISITPSTKIDLKLQTP